MERNSGKCIAFTLGREGGFVNNSADPGGATNMGITRNTLSKWLRYSASVADVHDLTRPAAVQIYLAWYWRPIAGDVLPSGADLMTFDMGVNSGEHEACVELQSVVGMIGADLDGHVGPKTLAAVRAVDPVRLIDDLAAAQKARYRSLATFPTFGRGWLSRADARVAAAKILVGTNSP